MLAVLSPSKLMENVSNMKRSSEAWTVDCMLNTFLFARKKLLNE